MSSAVRPWITPRSVLVMRESPSCKGIAQVAADCRPGSACVPAAGSRDPAAAHRPFSPTSPSIIRSAQTSGERAAGLGVLVLACGEFGLAGTRPRRRTIEGRRALHSPGRQHRRESAFAAHVKDERDRNFYAHFGFIGRCHHQARHTHFASGNTSKTTTSSVCSPLRSGPGITSRLLFGAGLPTPP